MAVSYSCRHEGGQCAKNCDNTFNIQSHSGILKSPANILVLCFYFILNLIHFMIVFSDLIGLFNAVYPVMPHFKFIKRSTVCIQASFIINFNIVNSFSPYFVYDSIHHILHCFFQKYVQIFKVILHRFQMRAH